MKKISEQYIAGFFDGEGSIGLYKRKDRDNGVILRIQLTQNKNKCSLLVLNFLKNKYGGNITEQKTLSRGVKYNWQLNAAGIPLFLKDIKRFLIFKKDQANLALYWLKNKPKPKRGFKGRIKKFTKSEIKFNNAVIRLMKLLKNRDVHKPLAVIKG